jgi:hypothetical protein
VSDGEIVESIQRRVTNRSCDACGETPTWNIQDGTYVLVEVSGDGSQLSGDGIPVYAVVCGNCGFLRLFSTLMGD